MVKMTDCRCGEKLEVDAPPFDEMSQEEIEEWRIAGGKVQMLCPNGCIQIRGEIMEFAEEMERNMRENDREKGDSWKTLPIEFLDKKWEEETSEYQNPEDYKELVDVGVVSMMLWQRLKNKGLNKR